MKIITHFFYLPLFLTAFALGGSDAKAQLSLSTYPTTIVDNGTEGISFELTANQTILLQSLDAALFSAGTTTFDLYYRVGGVESSPGVPPTINTANGWVLLGSGSASAATAGVPVPLPLAINLILTPGTYGIYMNTSNIGYRTWTPGSTDVFTDGIITIETGNNKGYGGAAPNPAFHPRQFVGTVHYLTLNSAPDDAGIASIDAPQVACEGEYEVLVTVKNYGSQPLTSVTIEWELDGVAQTPVVYTQTIDTLFGLNPNFAQVSLGTLNLNAGVASDLKVWTSLPNNNSDTVNYNDTVFRSYTNVVTTVSTFPYIEDFEGGQAGWTSGGTSSSWAFGTPAKPIINSASSGTNAFVVGGLSSQYPNGEKSQVESPCFDLRGFEGEAWVAMDVWWNSEFSWDGAVLQYTTDGSSWKNVGAMGDPHNWYTDNTISGNPGGQQEGWTGTQFSGNGSNGWVKAKHAVNQSVVGNRNVRFRVAFGSDGAVTDEGFAFDNFILTDYKRADLGPDRISFCGNPSVVLDPDVYYPGKIKWSTGDTISPTITVTTEDTYWVVFTDSLLDLTSADTVNLIKTDPPEIRYTKAVDTASVFSSVTIDPNLSYDMTFEWTPGNFPYPYLLVRGSDYGVGEHLFTLKVTDSVACTDEKVAIVVFFDYTGIDGLASGKVTFYPNPVEGMLTVDLQEVPAEQIAVYNMNGQLVYLQPLKERGIVQVDLTDQPAGMYVLKVQVGEEQLNHKFIKN